MLNPTLNVGQKSVFDSFRKPPFLLSNKSILLSFLITRNTILLRNSADLPRVTYARLNVH